MAYRAFIMGLMHDPNMHKSNFVVSHIKKYHDEQQTQSYFLKLEALQEFSTSSNHKRHKGEMYKGQTVA